jgi:hypothetical protein
LLGNGEGGRSSQQENGSKPAPNMNTSYPDFGLKGSYWTRGFDGSWDYGLRNFFSEDLLIGLKGLQRPLRFQKQVPDNWIDTARSARCQKTFL